MYRPRPVSYTHLDVYKRQAVVSAIFAQPDPGAATRHLLELARTMVASHG